MSQKDLPAGTKTGIGSLADEETKRSWARAWELLKRAPKTSPFDAYSWIAEQMGTQRRAVKRKLKNYKKWQEAQGTPVQMPKFARPPRSNDAKRKRY